ncbi:MAG: AsmA protein [Gammaproteobacteria bacterium]|jgi:AsmA protein
MTGPDRKGKNYNDRSQVYGGLRVKTLIKIIVGLVGLVVVVVVAAAVLVPMFFDPNDYKDELATLAKEHTGRELTIEGDIGLSVFPWIGLDLGVVELGNAPGFKAPRFARTEKVSIRLKLMPLLSKTIEMDTIVVHGLEVNVEKKADGTTNIPTAGRTGRETAKTSDSDAGEMGIAGVAIGGVDVRNGALSWSDYGSGASYTMINLAAQTGSLALGKPVDVTVSFEVAGKKPAMNGRVEFSAEVLSDLAKQLHKVSGLDLEVNLTGPSLPNGALAAQVNANATADLAKGTAVLSDLKIAVGDLNLSGALNLAGLDGAPTFKGNITLAQFDPKALMGTLGMAPIKTADDKVLRALSAKFALSGNASRAALNPLNVRIDDSTLKGKIELVDFARSALRFELELDAIDADRYLPAASESSASPASPGGGAAGASPIPLDTLRGIDAAGNLRIGKLKIAKLTTSQILVTLNAKDGLVRLNPVRAKLYEGEYSGDMKLDARGKVPALSINESLKGVKAGPLLTDLQGEDRLNGTTNLTASLTAQGAGSEAMKQSLNGRIRFDFLDGAIKGLNVAQMLRDAQAKLKGGSAGGAKGANQTDFSELGGTINIKNGLATNTDLSAKSPFLRIAGKGQASLVKETINYGLTTSVVASGAGQGGNDLKDLAGIDIPIKVTGTFSEPSYGLDFQALAGAFASSKASALVDKQKEAITKKAEDAIGAKLGGKLGGVLGGKSEGGGTDKIGGALKGLFKN